MIEGKTSSGFNYKIEEERAYSVELIEAVRAMDDNPAYMIDAAKVLLGEKQYKALKKHISGKQAFTSITKLEAEISEIFEALPKN